MERAAVISAAREEQCTAATRQEAGAEIRATGSTSLAVDNIQQLDITAVQKVVKHLKQMKQVVTGKGCSSAAMQQLLALQQLLKGH